jgi:hypothetical protein
MPPRSVRKVLMTADSVGGVWTYALQLASSLGTGHRGHACRDGRQADADQAARPGAITTFR